MTRKSMTVETPGANRLAELRVVDAMHPGVFTCPPDAPLETVAQMMSAYGIHCVVVFGDDDQAKGGTPLWGVVSDLDLVSVAASEDISGETAGSSAATPAVVVAPDESLVRAAQLMREHDVSHLVVTDPEFGKPVGILSTLDLATVLAPGPLWRKEK